MLEVEARAVPNQFFGMDEACELAIAKWGNNARCWNYEPRMQQVNNDRNKTCQIGVGGMGRGHVVLGSGPTWLDAAREAGLLGNS